MGVGCEKTSSYAAEFCEPRLLVEAKCTDLPGPRSGVNCYDYSTSPENSRTYAWLAATSPSLPEIRTWRARRESLAQAWT